MNDRYVTVVQRRHVRYREIVVSIAAVVVLVVLVVGFLLGQHAALSAMNSREVTPLPPPVVETGGRCEQAGQELQAALQEARVQHEVDVTALELARQDLLARDKRVVELEASLAFYRGLMLPGESRKGVSALAPQWVAGDTSGQYLFRLVVQQISRAHKKVSGKLRLTLIGEQAGDTAEIPLHMVSDSHPQKQQKLNFKYFQVIEGKLSLPSGFTPREVRVDIALTKPRKSKTAQTFAWRLQEAFRYDR